MNINTINPAAIPQTQTRLKFQGEKAQKIQEEMRGLKATLDANNPVSKLDKKDAAKYFAMALGIPVLGFLTYSALNGNLADWMSGDMQLAEARHDRIAKKIKKIIKKLKKKNDDDDDDGGGSCPGCGD